MKLNIFRKVIYTDFIKQKKVSLLKLKIINPIIKSSYAIYDPLYDTYKIGDNKTKYNKLLEYS